MSRQKTLVDGVAIALLVAETSLPSDVIAGHVDGLEEMKK